MSGGSPNETAQTPGSSSTLHTPSLVGAQPGITGFVCFSVLPFEAFSRCVKETQAEGKNVTMEELHATCQHWYRGEWDQSLPSGALVQLILLGTAGRRCKTEKGRMWSRYSMYPLPQKPWLRPAMSPTALHSAHAPRLFLILDEWHHCRCSHSRRNLGTSLVVQWPETPCSQCRGSSFHPWSENNDPMWQPRVYVPRLRPGEAKQMNKKGFLKKKTWRHPHLLFVLPPRLLTSFFHHI